MHGWIVRAGLLGLVASLVSVVPVVAPAQAADPPLETSIPVVTPPVWQKVLPDRSGSTGSRSVADAARRRPPSAADAGLASVLGPREADDLPDAAGVPVGHVKAA